MQIYKKDEKSGEYTEVGEEEFGKIFGERLDRAKKQEADRVREELSTKLKDELAPVFKKELTEELTKTLTEKISGEVKGEYESKLTEAEKKNQTLDVQLRQKTIAAEYGFKPDLESFLGEGDEEEMRKKADVLKQNASNSSTSTPPQKSTEDKTVKSSFVTKVD